nr:nucleotide-binding alpha-beta plait domain-containing protein [Tanacetum cinerariifolium]
MGSYRSKEDEVLKIFTSVFVANFTDSFGAKDLWNTCKQYGQVVDAYIPNRRSKASKRFGFVRFIKVLDVDRLVNNLCTVWVERHKLQTNIPRFQREPLKRHSSLHNIDGVKRGNSEDTYNSNGVKGAANSYAHVVKESQNSKMDSDSSPVMVLNDSCLNEKDYSLCLMGKVKDFETLANLKVVVANEGFDNIKFKYMGGYWVMIEFQTEVTKLKFQENSVMKTWFSQIQLASFDFNIDGRVTWVEIEGIPLNIWSKNNCMASKWGVALDVDDQEDGHFHRKRICCSYEEVPNGEDVKNVEDLKGDSGGEIVPDTKFKVDFPNQKGEEDSVGQGEVVIMGDFNEVRNKSKRFGTLFNRHGADVFNRFISNARLENVPLEGCSFTWCHKSATKMSKLDRFLISDSLLCSCPNISSITLDWYLSDHRPIPMREVYYDYGPVPFRFFHYWFEVDGFDKFIEDSWKDAPIIESNALVRMMKKLKYLKEKIRMWNKLNKEKSHKSKRSLLAELADCDAITDKGKGDNNVVNRRTEVVNLLQEVEKKNSLESAQKTKIKWAIEGDENSKYYYGVINKKRNQLSIRGILVEGTWIDSPSLVKKEIKKAMWDCRIDKSPGPDGFTFGFYRRYWKLIENDVVDTVTCFFHQVQWCKKKKKQSLVFKVDFEKTYDLVRWDHLDDIMRKFGFGEKWCMWIQSCLRSSRGSVIVNGSPTKEFQFYKGFKQGDPLSPFLFILVMESLHISFQRVVDVDKVGLGVSSLFALNRDLMFKWKVKSCYPSLWLDIIHEVEMFKSRGIDFVSLIHSKLGNGANTSFWRWLGTGDHRLNPFFLGSGEFTIMSVRKMIDDFMLPEVSSKTRWIKAVPIKVNVHAWKVKLDGLPSRLNISRRDARSIDNIDVCRPTHDVSKDAYLQDLSGENGTRINDREYRIYYHLHRLEVSFVFVEGVFSDGNDNDEVAAKLTKSHKNYKRRKLKIEWNKNLGSLDKRE